MPDEKSPRRLVYSTDSRARCPKCGWPAAECRCSSSIQAPDEPIPPSITAKLRVEHRASDKVVTVIDGLPANRTFLDGLARDLKKSCGTGGHAGVGYVELQGDHRERLREIFSRRGWTVRG